MNQDLFFARFGRGVRGTRWNQGAVKIIGDGGINVDALLEDTPDAAQERSWKVQCIGPPAQQLLNALQKVRTLYYLYPSH
jgi:hypothetical protein